MIDKYYEEIFEVPNEIRKFRFKNANAIDILAMAEEFSSFMQLKDMDMYKKLVNDILTNLEVDINDTWISVVNGKAWLPETLKSNLYGLRYIVNRFYEKVISQVFQPSSESVTDSTSQH